MAFPPPHLAPSLKHCRCTCGRAAKTGTFQLPGSSNMGTSVRTRRLEFQRPKVRSCVSFWYQDHQLISQTCFLCQGLFSNCIRCIEVQTIFFPGTISQDLRVPDHSCHAARGEEPRCSREAPNKAHVRVQLWAHSENTLTWPHDPKKLYLIDHNWINSIIVL